MPDVPPEPISLSELGIAAPSTKAGEPITPSSKYFLTKEELSFCIESAKKGDLKSAVKVLNFFTYVEYDADKGAYWVKYAAELGDSVAQHNLAMLYLQERNLTEAKLWAEKAIESDKNGSVDLLQEINEMLAK